MREGHEFGYQRARVMDRHGVVVGDQVGLDQDAVFIGLPAQIFGCREGSRIDDLGIVRSVIAARRDALARAGGALAWID